MRFEHCDGGGVRVSSPAKLNLYLEVLGKRPDGYHDIDSLMQAISLADTIQFRPRRTSSDVDLEVAAAPGVVPPPTGPSNLVVRAVDAVVEEIGRRPGGLAIRLRKEIPSGAGLGGGSSNAAATLLALDRLWELSLDRATLGRLAAGLGSDVAFFLSGGLARCQGRGEIVTPVDETASGEPLFYVLCVPPVSVSTAAIYREYSAAAPEGKPLTTPKPLATLRFSAIRSGLEDGTLLANRLQRVALELFPELRHVFDSLRKEPFVASQMTGSGSAFFGLSRDRAAAESAAQRLRAGFGEWLRDHPGREAKGFPAGSDRQVRVEVVNSLPRWD